MMLYSLLVLTNTIHKIIIKFKNTEIVLFTNRMLPCKQNCVHNTALYTINANRLKQWDPGHIRETGVIWCLKLRDCGCSCITDCLPNDCINIQRNTVLTFNHTLGVQINCLGYLWILRNVDSKFFDFENSGKIKIMIYGIHYFT